jgi:modulator of FtsH protease
MSEWSDFFIATTGASAALTGLIFVGVSINLTKILSIPTLPNRALISLILLLTIMVLSLLFIVPDQSLTVLGIEVLTLGMFVWLGISQIDIGIYTSKENHFKRKFAFNMAFNQIALLPYIIGGILILLTGNNGIYWIIPAVILSFIKAVLDAWVLLVEINR